MHKLSKNTADIFNEVNNEMHSAMCRWGGDDFDKNNTPNDWIAYITRYAGKALQLDPKSPEFRSNMIKVAGLAVRAVEQFDKDQMGSRHYDSYHDQTTIADAPLSQLDKNRCF